MATKSSASVAPNIIRKWSRREYNATLESRGRPARRPQGGWVTDLAEILKTVLLCWKCEPKFNHEKYGYVIVELAGHRYVTSTCDGCKTPYAKCTFYSHYLTEQMK